MLGERDPYQSNNKHGQVDCYENEYQLLECRIFLFGILLLDRRWRRFLNIQRR
jgi:hypothetical protein